MIFRLSPGNAHDGPEGRKLIEMLRELLPPGCKLLMDKAYCGAATRRLAEECELEPVVPPKSNAKKPWRYDAVCPVLVRPAFWALGHRALQETERGRASFLQGQKVSSYCYALR